MYDRYLNTKRNVAEKTQSFGSIWGLQNISFLKYFLSILVSIPSVFEGQKALVIYSTFTSI